MPVMRPGITVQEALRLPSLRRARLVAGSEGLRRLIRHVNVMEVPDILPFVKEHELLLTTAYPIRDDPRALEQLVPQFAERGLAALAIVPRPYLGELPAAALRRADELGFPIIELPDQTSFNEIMAEVLEPILDRQAVRLERSQAIHERLTAVVLEGGSFGELLDALADLLQRPVQIVDAHGRFVAASRPARDGAPPPADGGRIVRPISVGGTKLGEIVAAAGDREIGPEDLMALDQAATIAALQMAQARAVLSRERRYQGVLLGELVSGHSTSIAETIEHAAALGWNLRIPRVAVVVELREAVSGKDVLVAGQPVEDRLLHALESVLHDRAIVWASRAGFALLVDARIDPALVVREVREELGRVAPELRSSIGIGRASADASDLHRSYREASQALALGRDLDSDEATIAYERLGVYRLLHRLSSDPELRSYCEDLLGPLLERDRARGTELVATLDRYLANGRNIAATARDLSIHYNTLRYRLRKIDELVGGLDRHANSRLGLELALHGWRLLSDHRGHGRHQSSAAATSRRRNAPSHTAR